MDEPGTFREDPLDDTQFAKVQREIKCALEAIQYERGSYDFTVRLGSLAVKGMKDGDIGKQYPIPSFLKGVNSGTNVSCMVNKW